MKFDMDFEPKTYSRFLDRAKDRDKLIEGLEGLGDVVVDALAQAKAMASRDWKKWRKGLNSERKGVFAGEAWAARFGCILMPSRLLLSARVSEKFVVPMSVAYFRLEQTGEFEKRHV